MTWNYELFIDGAWTSEGASGSIDVLDPATEEVIGSVPEASTKTAVRAIEAARRAFDEGPWPYMKPAERAAKLVAMAEILEARAGDLRELIVAEKCAADAEWRADRRAQFVPGIGTNRVHLETCSAEGDFKQTKYGMGTRYKSAEYIGQIVPPLTSQVGEENVLVLTPYRAQRGLIKTFLRNAGQTKVLVSTVHRAQGSEYHTVIFDPVIATGEKLLGHPVEGPRLINVALSRAKARLVVIMSVGDYDNEYLRRVAQLLCSISPIR